MLDLTKELVIGFLLILPWALYTLFICWVYFKILRWVYRRIKAELKDILGTSRMPDY